MSGAAAMGISEKANMSMVDMLAEMAEVMGAWSVSDFCPSNLAFVYLGGGNVVLSFQLLK